MRRVLGVAAAVLVVVAAGCGGKEPAAGGEPAVPGMPKALGSSTFSIGDLPDYPGATRQQLETRDTASGRRTEATFVTTDALDSVRGFYDVALAASRWQVIESGASGEGYRWRLMRGASTAVIELSDNPAGGARIHLIREDR
jgi:hypothetical protein